jgi:hypothetical protein
LVNHIGAAELYTAAPLIKIFPCASMKKKTVPAATAASNVKWEISPTASVMQ